MHDIAVAMVCMIRVIKSFCVEPTLRDLTANVSRVSEKLPELRRTVDPASEMASTANDGNGFVKW